MTFTAEDFNPAFDGQLSSVKAAHIANAKVDTGRTKSRTGNILQKGFDVDDMNQKRMQDIDTCLDKETYRCQAICSNCGDFHLMRIVKSLTVASTPCPTCGCKELTIRPKATM